MSIFYFSTAWEASMEAKIEDKVPVVNEKATTPKIIIRMA
jgi:hypothetical protein